MIEHSLAPSFVIPIRRNGQHRVAREPSGLVQWLFASLEAFRASWILELLPGAPRYLPLVEIAEFKDREIYHQAPIPVRVSRTRSGEFLMALAEPLEDSSQVEATVVENHVVLKLPGSASNEIASASCGRRTYSFPLPGNCDASTLEAHLDDGLLTMVARRIGKRISKVFSQRHGCHAA